MLVDSSATLLGFVLLMLGADFFVRGSVALARRLGISTLVIGLTVVAFGTSLPELLVSLSAALSGAKGMAVGNVVGSNIANILLILGAAAVISPVRGTRTALFRDGTAMLAATALFIAFGLLGTLSVWHGATGLVLLGAYLYSCYRSDVRTGDCLPCEEAEEVAPLAGSLRRVVPITIVGLLGVTGGAQLLVYGATGLAREMGVSEEIIGLTLVAIGTSLPELATTIAAAVRRHADVVLGNVLGSNLFNLLFIMGAVTLFVPIDLEVVAPKIAVFDLWAMFAVSILLVPLLATGFRLSRGEGALLLVAYGAFIAAQFLGVGEMMMARAGS